MHTSASIADVIKNLDEFNNKDDEGCEFFIEICAFRSSSSNAANIGKYKEARGYLEDLEKLTETRNKSNAKRVKVTEDRYRVEAITEYRDNTVYTCILWDWIEGSKLKRLGIAKDSKYISDHIDSVNDLKIDFIEDLIENYEYKDNACFLADHLRNKLEPSDLGDACEYKIRARRKRDNAIVFYDTHDKLQDFLDTL